MKEQLLKGQMLPALPYVWGIIVLFFEDPDKMFQLNHDPMKKIAESIESQRNHIRYPE